FSVAVGRLSLRRTFVGCSRRSCSTAPFVLSGSRVCSVMIGGARCLDSNCSGGRCKPRISTYGANISGRQRVFALLALVALLAFARVLVHSFHVLFVLAQGVEADRVVARRAHWNVSFSRCWPYMPRCRRGRLRCLSHIAPPAPVRARAARAGDTRDTDGNKPRIRDSRSLLAQFDLLQEIVIAGGTHGEVGHALGVDNHVVQV